MTVRPAGLNYEVEVGDDTPLFTKTADVGSFRLYSLRYLPFILGAMAVFLIVFIIDGEWYFGAAFAGVLTVFAVYLFAFTKPKVSYFVTSGKVGIGDRRSWGYYEYRDVRKVVLRKRSHSITLRGPGSQPVKIDLYLAQADYDWFVAEIVPKFPNAAVQGI